MYTVFTNIILHFSSKGFTTATGLGGIRVLEREASADEGITEIQLHTIDEEEALRITNCKERSARIKYQDKAFTKEPVMTLLC